MTTHASNIHLVLGLGNPSDEYLHTYHNIGRLFVETVVGQSFETPSKKPFSYSKRDGIIFAHANTFMNESGKAAKEALSYFEIEPKHLLIAHDDSDMTVGTWKLSFDQRSAGHKGIQSIIDALGTQEFWRLKIGIRPANERTRKKAEEFVLKKISKKDQKIFEEIFGDIIREIL